MASECKEVCIYIGTSYGKTNKQTKNLFSINLSIYLPTYLSIFNLNPYALATKAEVLTLVFLSSERPYLDRESTLLSSDGGIDSAKMKCDCLGPVQTEPDIFVKKTKMSSSKLGTELH